jgi:Uma2 family endonuclease
MSIVPRRKFTLQEYLAREETSPTRHEFYRGEIFAMSGGSLSHGMIATNIAVKLSLLLANRGCRPYSSDHRTASAELHTYPDLVVVCGDPIMSDVDPYAITNPVVIVEVLSPSTANYDRGKKFELYWKIKTFRDYVLVDQFEPRIECFSRDASGLWRINVVTGLDATLNIPSLNCDLPLRDVYLDVKFVPEEG